MPLILKISLGTVRVGDYDEIMDVILKAILNRIVLVESPLEIRHP